MDRNIEGYREDAERIRYLPMAGIAFVTDLPFQVEEWDAAGNKALRTLAKCATLEIATYLYEAAVAAQTDKTRVLILRDRIQLLKDSRGLPLVEIIDVDFEPAVRARFVTRSAFALAARKPRTSAWLRSARNDLLSTTRGIAIQTRNGHTRSSLLIARRIGETNNVSAVAQLRQRDKRVDWHLLAITSFAVFSYAML